MLKLKILAAVVVWAGWISTARAADAPVTLTDDGGGYVLGNGIVSARVEKQTGDLVSLRYKDMELLGAGPGRSNGYWSLPGTTLTFGSNHIATIRTDPKTNDGQRATVSCKFTYDGKPGTVPADVELCYSLGRGDSALYLVGLWSHDPGYPAISFPVGRFAAKLNPSLFNYLAVDPVRQRVMPTPADWGSGVAQNMKEARLLTTGQYKGEVEHKYDYAAVQYDNPAYGWASSTGHFGLWMVTPSNEYMSGGCTKVELNAHLDGNESGFPTLLNVWKGPHYGGSILNIAKGEKWVKCIGPFLLYCNSADDGRAMWKDALARAAQEAKAWPYDWVDAPAIYAPKAERSTVTGRIVLDDPIVKPSQISHLMVGLAAPGVDWQRDGKFYQFWVQADDEGKFTIPNVRAGKYTLHAFATGVLGEDAKTDISVAAGIPLDIGTLNWKPVRYGTQVWDIGYPDRTAGKFFNGENYWHWGLYIRYATDFPHDVHYVIGKSDYHKDWNLMQVPHEIGPDANGRGRGSATTWTVSFPMTQAPHGKATLRVAIAGSEVRALQVAMNGKPAGMITNLPNTMVIHRDSDRGYWSERWVAFDASLMKDGDNVLGLTIPAGQVTQGIEYDYLRLELDESAAPPAAPIQSPAPAPNEIYNRGADAG
jgi:rhamnogalacturonan endolyase